MQENKYWINILIINVNKLEIHFTKIKINS